MTSAATGSAHHSPRAAFKARPARVVAERYQQANVWWLSAMSARLPSALPVSSFARDGILARLRLPAARVFVAGEAPDPVFRRLPDAQASPHLLSFGIPFDAPLVVYAGGFSPHKNVDLLVDAFAAVRRTHPRCRLVLVGELESEVFHSALATIRARVAALGADSGVTFTGYLPDADLAALLNLAEVLVLPSMMEGFGLPAVEAAACGCPVIATAASPLPALLGDAARFVRPGDSEDLRRALHEVLASPALRQRMRERGLAAAARLSWDDAAARVAAIVAEVVAS